MAAVRSPLVWLLAGVLLAACARPSAGPAPLTLVQTQPVTLPVPGRENGAVAAETEALLHRSLVTLDPEGRLVPDAATDVPSKENGGISADGLAITYHIRPGLRFSDGTPLRAQDAAATIDALRDPESLVTSRLGIDDVVSVQATGALSLTVRLARPYAPILLYLCGPGNATAILPAGQAGNAERSVTSTAIAGAGPYRVRAFQTGDRLELEPNPYYSPRPHLAGLVVRTVGTAETAHVQLHTGEASGYVMADPALAAELSDLPAIRLSRTPVDGIGALIFNVSAPDLASAVTRHALVDAIDIAASVRRVFRGGVFTAAAGEGLFLWAYDRHAFPEPHYDPGAAAALLDSQGWHLGSDGKRYRGGAPLEITMIVRSDQPSSGALAATFAQQLRAAGVAVTMRRYAIGEWGAADGPLYRGSFDVAIAQFVAGLDPDVTDQFACDRIPPHGYNKPRYCNPQLDRLLADGAATYATPKRIAIYRRVQQILARDLPMMPLYRLISLDALPANLRGVSATPVTPFYRVANWQR